MVSKAAINIPSVVKMEIAEIAAKITGIILPLCFPFIFIIFSIKAILMKRRTKNGLLSAL